MSWVRHRDSFPAGRDQLPVEIRKVTRSNALPAIEARMGRGMRARCHLALCGGRRVVRPLDVRGDDRERLARERESQFMLAVSIEDAFERAIDRGEMSGKVCSSGVDVRPRMAFR